MITECHNLYSELLQEYGDRKKAGRFSLLIDHKNKIPYIVPRNIEHINYAKEILQTENLQYLYPFPLVPSHIHFKGKPTEEIITGVITGESGLEQKFGKIHNHQSLKKAHEIIWNLIVDTEIPLNIKENKIIFDYAR